MVSTEFRPRSKHGRTHYLPQIDFAIVTTALLSLSAGIFCAFSMKLDISLAGSGRGIALSLCICACKYLLLIVLCSLCRKTKTGVLFLFAYVAGFCVISAFSVCTLIRLKLALLYLCMIPAVIHVIVTVILSSAAFISAKSSVTDSSRYAIMNSTDSFVPTFETMIKYIILGIITEGVISPLIINYLTEVT